MAHHVYYPKPRHTCTKPTHATTFSAVSQPKSEDHCFEFKFPHPILVQALDLAYKPILSPTGLEAFSEILWLLSSTEVRYHIEKLLTSDKFPLVCIHYDLGHFDSHHGRFIQSPNKICLWAEVSVRVVGPLRHYIFILCVLDC
jgi:hypothetical protein